MQTREGVTLAELVITLAIMVILMGVFAIGFLKQQGRKTLDVTVRHVAALLREAEMRSVAREGGVGWGVHLENSAAAPTYALFSGSYSPSTVQKKYALPPMVAYATSSPDIPVGSSLDITFAQSTGIPSAPATVVFALYDNLRVVTTTSLTVSEQGLISY